MFRNAIPVLAAAVLCAAGAAAFAGPYHVELPVRGLTAEHLDEVRKALSDAMGRNVLQVKCTDGVLSFHAGGEGPKALLRMGDLSKALAKAKLRLDPDSWMLKPQAIGLCVTADKGISVKQLREVLQGIKGVDLKVLGSILDGTRLCVVVELEKEAAYETLRKGLESSGVTIVDLVWGHWKYGWNIGDPHSHEVGARLRAKQKK